jgi:hypothetical protein
VTESEEIAKRREKENVRKGKTVTRKEGTHKAYF